MQSSNGIQRTTAKLRAGMEFFSKELKRGLSTNTKDAPKALTDLAKAYSDVKSPDIPNLFAELVN